MTKCPNCQAKNAPDDLRCAECGTVLNEAAQRSARAYRRSLFLLYAGTGIVTAFMLLYAFRTEPRDKSIVVNVRTGRTPSRQQTRPSPEAQTAGKPRTNRKRSPLPTLSPSDATGDEVSRETQIAHPPKPQVVYLADYGRYYHRKGCRALRRYKKATTRKEAKRRGLKPCPDCEPP